MARERGPAVSDLTLMRELLKDVDSTAICDADKETRVMSASIGCRSRNPDMAGPAFTVRCRDDFFAVLCAIEDAAPGDVIVVDGGGREIALAGELFARAALARGLAGIIVDGGYRDMGYVASCTLPVYSRHVTPIAGTTGKLGQSQTPVTCGGVTVAPGDVVVADADGIIVLNPATAVRVLTAAAEVKAAEARVIAHLGRADGTLVDCLNVTEHRRRLAAGQASSLRFTV